MKYHVPTGFGFSPKASGFYPFDDATALAGESGVGDVAWLIQASASNHKPKGRFFWYAFGIYKPKEPSLWFACHMSPTPTYRNLGFMGGRKGGGRVNDCITFFYKNVDAKILLYRFFGNFAENSRIGKLHL